MPIYAFLSGANQTCQAGVVVNARADGDFSKFTGVTVDGVPLTADRDYIIASAELIVRCFHDVGRVYRIGGDEFVALMPNTTSDTISGKLAHFEQACHAAKLSIACGSAYADNAEDISQMLRNADNAMYDNKRNRVVNR